MIRAERGDQRAHRNRSHVSSRSGPRERKFSGRIGVVESIQGVTPRQRGRDTILGAGRSRECGCDGRRRRDRLGRIRGGCFLRRIELVFLRCTAGSEDWTGKSRGEARGRRRAERTKDSALSVIPHKGILELRTWRQRPILGVDAKPAIHSVVFRVQPFPRFSQRSALSRRVAAIGSARRGLGDNYTSRAGRRRETELSFCIFGCNFWVIQMSAQQRQFPVDEMVDTIQQLRPDTTMQRS